VRINFSEESEEPKQPGMSNIQNVTPDGKVTKEVIFAGSGPQPIRGQKVAVHYVGTLTNGTQIDSSRERGKEFCFTIGQGVISGWSLGVATMKVGETSKFTMGPEYAYGSKEFTGLFPAESTLVFEIELLKIF
jgi:FKBP-type peptidyl-prolyl cis-trans isomerase